MLSLLKFEPFKVFVKNNTTSKSRSRYSDSFIIDAKISFGDIHAKVRGSKLYSVHVNFNASFVISAACTCPYDQDGYCKHIVNVLVYADQEVRDFDKSNLGEKQENTPKMELNINRNEDKFILSTIHILNIKLKQLKDISLGLPRKEYWRDPISIEKSTQDVNRFDAKIMDNNLYKKFNVTVEQIENELHLTCSCENKSQKICAHIHYLLNEILNEEMLQMAFNPKERTIKYQEKANALGLKDIANLDDIFHIEQEYSRLKIEPKISLFSLDERNKALLKTNLLSQFQFPTQEKKTETKKIIVVSVNKYGQNRYQFSLMNAPLSKSGEIKSPITAVNLTDKIRETKDSSELSFYTSLLTLQASEYGKVDDSSIYLDIFKNPFELSFYLFDENDDKKVTPKSLTLINPVIESPQATIKVDEKGDFYVLTCKVQFNNKTSDSKYLKLKDFFVLTKDSFHLVNNEKIRKVIAFFKENKHTIYLHKSQFKEFKETFLDELENYVAVTYSFVKVAEKKVKKSKKSSEEMTHQNMICLSEFDNYILITPVMKYDEVEISILSKKNIYTENPDGTLTPVERDEKAEIRFLRNIQKQHESFIEYPTTTFFYLHKQEFLEDGWFIDAFEDWRNSGYEILGFSQLKNNTYNPNKMKVTTRVESGIDWFDVSAAISFGNQNVSLKDIQKSIINKNRYVKLGDGTHGLLPQDWVAKFGHYFRTGEVKDDIIRTHKSNFHIIDELFDKEVLSEKVKMELENYREKLSNFQSIRNISVPTKLKATLRDYQKEGLNWLNFLDEFNFGGCLADDMGLGKTVQIIAYFLAQHEKGNKGVNLVILPTSLLFNWQKEIEKFAPHLKFQVLYGANRTVNKAEIKKQHVILTTYGTLLADIEKLRDIEFNIIVLDESQAIKNIESKRYKAVRLLQGRQRLVVTGTPVENNTFDLFAQLSFATPGLLGSAKRFSTDYSTPIDKFADAERAKELQQKVHPFILRRTKKQVAKELPEKTEMIVYCEMDTAQRRVYDTYKTEFQKYLAGISDDELHSSSLHVLQGLTKLRQICNSPALLSDEEFYGDQSAKLETLMEYVEDLKGEHKIIIFSQFVGMLELIKAGLEKNNVPFAYLTGKTRNREEQVDLFQNDDEIRVFLISLKAGGTGLNLTKAEYVFLVDPWWNPAVENQAIDRAYRIGQENKVVAIRLITPDTIEEKIMELQQRKKQLVEDLIHTDTNVLKQLNREDLMKML